MRYFFENPKELLPWDLAEGAMLGIDFFGVANDSGNIHAPFPSRRAFRNSLGQASSYP